MCNIKLPGLPGFDKFIRPGVVGFSYHQGKAVVQMTADTYLQRGRVLAARLAQNGEVRRWSRVAAYAASGFLLSGASLLNSPQSFAMALVSALTGWRAAVAALGSLVGYGVYWANRGVQGMVWTALSGLTALFLGKRKLAKDSPLLIPALCGLWTAAVGLAFQLLGEDTPTGVYLLRVVLAPACSRLFALALGRKDPVLIWPLKGIAVLALAQTAPVPWLGLGYIAAGALALGDGFPAAALAGLALDLARVTPVPMTAVVCAISLTRLIPGIPDRLRLLMPGAVYLLVMPLCGWMDVTPLPGLMLGGLLSVFLPQRAKWSHRRGETGAAQVRLEVMAGVLSQTRQLFLEVTEPPIDEEALLARTRERACGTCPNRKACHAPDPIPRELLRRPLVENVSLPFPCRKSGRMILELRRTQEQYRNLRADRERRREYRRAVVQQYGFLSEYLRTLSDQLPQRGRKIARRFSPEAAVASRGREPDNGDRCRYFHGPGGRFFLLLCDGMGTGLGAAQEGGSASELLRQMLSSGFPAEHALGSLNSLLALRGRAGAVTVDLVEVRLDTGAVSLYKWGAAPSYLLRGNMTEKIGTAGPPPGIDTANARETVQRLSLRRGETLIILSDGVDGEEVRRCAVTGPGQPPGEMAAKLLEAGAVNASDDATVAVVRLHPALSST